MRRRFDSGTIDVLNRNPESGALSQKPAPPAAWRPAQRRTARSGVPSRGVSSLAVSPDGRYVYSAAFKSDAVGVFRRVTK